MAEIDHWHPVCLSQQLKDKPVGVVLAGQEIVLFRGAGGQIGALQDLCPHRRMRLSRGKVVDGKLQCSYHGWTYDVAGAGQSPGTPKLHACVDGFDAREENGAIWVKSRESNPVFPPFEVDGFLKCGTLLHFVKGPLETVLDNFCEIEHTPTTHELFGYPLERMDQVTVRFEPTATTVRVINAGPAKQIPLLYRALLGMRKHYQFNDDWTTYFSPVYSIYDHWWSDPVSGCESLVRLRSFLFFWEADPGRIGITSFVYVRSRHPGPQACVKPFRGLLKRLADREVRLDVNVIEGLADQDPSLEGLKLSRFDRALMLNRQRIERVYRGRGADGVPLDCTPSAHVRGESAKADGVQA
jgi:vanillate O-demethylase monooxygenase subunit